MVEWDNRRLKKYKDVNYTYDGYGKRRSKKKEGEEEHTYEWLGEELRGEKYGKHTLRYEYGGSGIAEVYLDGARYIYVRNGQGDVVGILDGTGRLSAEYIYDAWGNHEVKCYDAAGAEVTDEAAKRNHIGRINPIRYRGYYYDEETELYCLESRYYDPWVGRFVSADDIEYLAPGEHQGFNLYAYCGNNPVMYVDPSGHFPLLALLLGITALVGMGLTIGGVASDNNTLTAVGLTMVAVPAIISGGLAVAAGVGGATLTGIIGGATATAGIGTGLFASAEYQEAFTGNNWMLDAGMSEGWYNGLMLTTAAIATAGTSASMVGYNFHIKSINKVGKLIPSNHPNQGYWGIRFKNNRGALQSIELQNHAPHGLHFQLNSWNPLHMSVRTIRRWKWFLTRM